jgi:hypothetical protein
MMKVLRTASGAVAGALATAPMTLWMWVGQAASHHPEQPPKTLVRKTANRLGIPAKHGPGTVAASTLAHIGFGASCGALYATLVRRSTVPRGVAFGMAVWASSYIGWIPALRLLPPPHRDASGRVLTTMTAHAVYGAALGGALRLVTKGESSG